MAKITGTNNGETLNGTKTDDEIYLLDGNDKCTADLGNDTVYGGFGDDIIWGRYSNTVGDDGNDTFYGEAGNDSLYGGTGDDNLDGGDGNDKLDGEEGSDTLLGGTGSDNLDGGEGNDLLYGGDGDDTFYAGSGNDKAWGGNGNDIIWAIYTGELDDGNDTFYGEAGDDKLYGYAGNDTLDGGDGADYISGGAGEDLMYGGSGDDTIYAGSGNDKAWGGDGNDVIWAIFTGELDDGDDIFYGEVGDDRLYGYAGNDTLDGGDGADYLSGGEGNDSLLGGIGNDSIYGGSSNDTLDGSEGVDYLSGGDGNDSLLGGTGDDDLFGGLGNDTLEGGEGSDYFDGGDGNDTLNGSLGNDTMWGGAGDDFIDSGVGDNKLYGEAGNDSLRGGLGNDSLYGGSGNDTLDGGDGADYFDGGSGNDALKGGLGIDILWGGVGDDTIDGGDGDDKISGENGNDTLAGSSGDDTMYGDDGDDTLEGGSGNDLLYGGAGLDVAIFTKSSSSYTIQIDGPCVFVVDKLTNEKDKLTGIEKLSFAGVVSDVSSYGTLPVDFNSLSIPEKNVLLESQYKALIFEGTKKISGSNITYSFAQSSIYYDATEIPAGETFKFQPLGSYLQKAIEQTLNYLSQILSITFTQTTDTAGATLKFGSHNMMLAGYAFPPGYKNSGVINLNSTYNNNQLGQYGLGTLIHELGHALGLDHTSSRGEITAGEAGGDDPPSLPDYIDRTTFSIMSYSKSNFDDARQASYSALDIRTFFSLYGKKESNQDNTFKLHFDAGLSTTSKQSSLNQITSSQWDIYGYAPFMITDNGGNDVLDVSDWKGGVKVDLSGWGVGPINGVSQKWNFNSVTNGTLYSESEPGSAMITFYPDTKIETIIGSSENDLITGYLYNETINAGSGNDLITGGGGDDNLNGGAGLDVAVYSSNYMDYKISSTPTTYQVLAIQNKDGTDTLTNVERLKFSDKSIAIDFNGNAGTTAKVIGAVLGKSQVLNPTFVGLGLSYLDKGMTYSDLGALALTAIGATTNDAVVSTLWKNVIGTDATSAIKAPYIKMLTDGMKVGDLVVLAADTSFNTTNINLVGLAQTGIEYLPVV